MGPFQTIDDVISLLLRRRWLILAVTVLGVALSLAYARARPALYETSAVIQVAGPAVSTADLPAASAEMLQLTEQQLMTRENLAEVIDRHQLFADQPGLGADEKDAALRRAIRFETVARATGGGPSNTLSAIRITTTLGNADLAARVANDFAQSILDDSTAAQLTKTAETAAFYRDEADRIAQQIAALDPVIAAFKAAHRDALRQSPEDRQESITRLNAKISAELLEIDAKTRAAAEIAKDPTPTARDKANLAETQTAIDVLRHEIDVDQTRLAKAETALAASQQATQTLEAYTRQMQQLQDQFTNLSNHRTEAETAHKLAERQQAERFSMLERANIPQRPIGISHKTIAVLGAFASLMLALALAVLADLIRPVITNAARMQRALGVEPMVSIPEVRKPAGAALLQLIDDPDRPIFGLPRFAVVAAATTLALLGLAALIG